MNLRDMQEKREKLYTEARERLDLINNSTDESRATELESAHDAAMAALDALDSKIDRELRLASAEKKMEESREAFVRNGRPPFAATEATAVAKNEGVSYRDAFHSWLQAGGKLSELDSESRAVLAEVEKRAQTTLSGAAGQYAVPTEMLPKIISSLKFTGPMYDANICGELVTMGGQQIQIPTVNDTANTGAAFTQGTAIVNNGSGDVAFGQKTLNAYAFNTPWLNISAELASDSIIAMESVIAELIGKRLGRIANSYLTIGTGSNQPMGIVTACSTVAQATAAGSGNVLSFDDVLGLVHSVDPAYRSSDKTAFMFSDNTLKTLRKIKDGQGRYIWDLGNVRDAAANTIYGYAYHVNQYVADNALSAKSMVFGDLSQFWVRKVGAPTVGAVQDSQFYPGFGLAGYIRFDSQLVDSAAVKVLAQNAT
jgi:HK97 family phage major capsid protein